ncbi:sporulation protein [Bacillota bacterium LX-D]|nr:sporulation protein [Bacillota bacterium LX-D]
MSFLGRAMASIGIGSAKVDTYISNTRLRPEENLIGQVKIVGGNIAQQIAKIYLYLMTHYFRESNDTKIKENIILAQFELTDSFLLNPKEKREIPFSFIIPKDTPVTIGNCSVWVHTGLDIKMGIDPTDYDKLHILPHRYTEVILEALNNLGFILVQCENEYSRLPGKRLPFVQEFEFKPGELFKGQLAELEVVFLPNQYGIELILEIDRSARSLKGLLLESLDLNERLIRIKIPDSELEKGSNFMADYLSKTISRYLY